MKTARNHHVIYKKGFTITELLIVMAIAGILMATVIYGLKSSRNRARVATAKNNLRFYGMAVKQYHNDNLFSDQKWPANPTAGEYTASSCTSKYLLVPVDLQAYLKQGTCSDFYYDNSSDLTAKPYVQAVWFGLDSNIFDGSDKTVFHDPGKSKDNLVLLIYGDQVELNKIGDYNNSCINGSGVWRCGQLMTLDNSK